MHDHTGNFDTAIDGVNTPELQQADNDYAVGLLVQKIASSRYANNTLVFVIEDDSQDGADHVDSHRTVAFVAGAWVKQGALVSTRVQHHRLRAHDRGGPRAPAAEPQRRAREADGRRLHDDARGRGASPPTPSAYLYGTQLPLPPKPAGLVVPQVDPRRDVLGRRSRRAWTSRPRTASTSAHYNRITLDRADGRQALSRRRRPDWTCARTARSSSRSTGSADEAGGGSHRPAEPHARAVTPGRSSATGRSRMITGAMR